MFSLQFDMFLGRIHVFVARRSVFGEEKGFCCSLICFWKGKILSLQDDLFLERKSVLVAV